MPKSITARMTLPDGSTRDLDYSGRYATGDGMRMTLNIAGQPVELRSGESLTIAWHSEWDCKNCGKPIRKLAAARELSAVEARDLDAEWVHEGGGVLCRINAPRAEP